MGVLSESIKTGKTKSVDYSAVVVDKVTIQLEQIKTIIDTYLKYLSEISVVKQSCDLVTSAIEQIKLLKITVWSKEKAYQLFTFLAKQLLVLQGLVSQYTAGPLTYCNDVLSKMHVQIVEFICVYFEKLDEDLVTPVVDKTKTGAITLLSTVHDGAISTIDRTNKNVIEPTTVKVKTSIVEPSIKTLVATKNCLLKTSATVDTKMQLSEWLSFALSTSKKYDSDYLGGFVTRNSSTALSTAYTIDEKYTKGKISSTVDKTYKEFQMCKQMNSGVTSAGAPVTSVGATVVPKVVKTTVTSAGPIPQPGITSAGAPVYVQKK